MASIENRVVRMEFDNAAFESKVKQTLGSLKQLDQALKFDGGKKGLADVSAAANKFNLGPMSTAISGVSAKFLALSTIAVTALSRITDRAITAATQFSRAFTLDPLIQGYQEYELKMGSIQTIMAGSGESLSVVNQKLQELNEYADKTIYSFADMTTNIGKFTNAGVDLDTAVASIQGVANVAAVSGANAGEASRAMYNFAQALSKGYVQLIDWKSIELANMGTAEFKQQLIDAAEAAGTLTRQGDAWVTKSGMMVSSTKNFNESLTDQWLTTEVLNSTLGDYADATTDIGKKAFAAAQDVKTFSQLIDTVKEAIGSGWAYTFEILIGNFDEAKSLLTSINNVVSGFIERSAEARNSLLTDWVELGGRTLMLESFRDAFKSLGEVLSPIKEAFRDIFPPLTAERLYEITESFAGFVKTLKPSETTIENVRSIFSGFFSALDIGWEIIKQGAIFIKDLVVELTGLGNGNILEFAAGIGDFFTSLREGLDKGEKIKEFFDNVRDALDGPMDRLQKLGDAFGTLFAGLGDLKDALSDFASEASDIFGDFLDVLSEWATSVKEKFKETFGIDQFSELSGAMSVGLLGGIAVLLRKFMKEGFSADFSGGIIESIKGTFDSLTETLEAMQSKIKSDALLKIAAALAVLTASVVVLSLVDAEALAKALSAMTVGFGQLIGAFALLNKFDLGPAAGLKIGAIAAALLILSGAMLLLSVSVTILSRLSWSELLRGLVGVTVMLGALSAVSVILSKQSGSMIRAGVGMIAMAVAINLLALAVKQFAGMSWGEMVKGLVGVTAGLLIMAGAMHLMPKGMALQAVGLILVSAALNILAKAVSAFADMSWSDMARGFVGVAAGLLIIAGAMHLMPKNMLLTAAGLFIVSLALKGISEAVGTFGGMSWGEMAKGLVGLAASLIILAVAAKFMSANISGAIAIYIMAQALEVLAEVLVTIGELSWGELIKGLVGLALALTIIGVAATLLTPAIPSMLGMAAAIALLGVGLALIGIGADKFATAMQKMAKAGKDGAEGIVAAMQAIGRALPDLFIGFAKGLVDFIKVLGSAAAEIAKALGKILDALLDELIKLVPKVGELILTLVETLLDVLVTAYPQIVAAGINLILALLTGIRNNIYQIVSLAVQIIAEFISGIADNIELIIAAGVDLIVSFINGIADNIQKIYDAAANLIGSFILAVAGFWQDIIDLGVELLVNFLSGMTDNIQKVTDAVGVLIITFIGAVADLALSIATAGTDALVDFLGGMTNNLQKVVNAVTTLITTFITSVGNNANRIVTSGANAIIKFVVGLGRNAGRVVQAGVTVIINFLRGVSAQAIRLARAAADVVIDFLNALARVIREKSPELRQAGLNIVSAVLDGITGGLSSKAASVAQKVAEFGENIVINPLLKVFDISSPSKVTDKMGQQLVAGLAIGLGKTRRVDRSISKLGNETVASITSILGRISKEIDELDDFNPVIAPVLDLTNFREEARGITDVISDPAFAPSGAYKTAQSIAASPNPRQEPIDRNDVSDRGVHFQQIINSPERLSASDIYKQTRNQITIAKEELDVA